MKTLLNYRSERLAGGWFVLLLTLLISTSADASGIQDVAPTAADAPVMLETGRAGFGSFADFTSAPSARLYVRMRPDEVLYLGLSPEYTNNGEPFNSPSSARYQFRIRRENPDGIDPVVHGPFTITNQNANVNTYEDARYGVYATDATVGGQLIYEFRPDVLDTVNYYIEFDDVSSDGDQRVNIPFWDFTVTKDGQPIEGRVYSQGWAFRTPKVDGTVPPDCVWDRQFNGKLFSYTDDGFVSLIDFEGSGFQGLSFNIAFNSTGPGTSGDLGEDRKSIPGINQTLNSREHLVFLQAPDIEEFPSGVCGEVIASETFICTETVPYCLEVSVDRAGQVELLLDFNGNGILDDNTQDLSIVYDFSPDSLSACIPWNGLRGDGTPVDFTDTVDVIIVYSQGVQHYAAYDVEFLKNGFCVETVRPTCEQTIESNNLYYDDTDIPEDPGTGSPKDGRAGCDCETPDCRTWNNFNLNEGASCNNFNDGETQGYGDKSTLNTWWFANSRTQFRARVPVVSARIEGPTALCQGQSAVLFAVDQGTDDATETYLWSGPGVDGITEDSVTVNQAGQYCVTISSSNGCSSETCRTVDVLDFTVDELPAELSICFGESVQLPQAGNPGFTYLWSPAEGIDNVNSNQPVFSPLTTTTYSVTVSSVNSNGQICEATDEILIDVAPEIGLQVTGGGPICDAQTTFTASTLSPATIVLFAPDGTEIGTGTEFTVDVSGDTDYLLVATNDRNCTDSITFNVAGGPVDIAVPDSVLVCLSEGVNLGVTNLDANDMLTYSWAPAELFDAATLTAASPTFTAEPGDYTVTVTVTNQFGCEAIEDVRLVVLDDSETLSFSSEVDCDGQTVSFTNTSTADFGFLYDFGDGNTSTEASPTHVYASPGTYTVALGLIYEGQTCITAFTQEVTAFEAVLDAGFTLAEGACDNGTATFTFSDNSLNATGAALTYSWTFTGAEPATSTEANPTVTVSASGTVTGTLEVTSADNCSSTTDTSFTVNLAVVNLAEEIIICPGDSTDLNPGADGGLIYSWSPATDFGADEANPTTGTPGTYIVTVTANSADFNCENVDTVTVVVADSIQLVISGPDGPLNDADGDGNGDGNGGNGTGGGTGGGGNGADVVFPTVASCGTPIDLSVNLEANEGVTVTYTDLDGNVLGEGGNITLTPNDRDTVVVTAVNAFGCIERDTIVLINNQVDAAVDVGADGLNFCAATDTSVAVVNNDLRDTLTYVWEPNDIINGPLDGPTVDITSPAEGTTDLMVTVTNQFGCDTMITVTITSTPFTPNSYPDVVQPCFNEAFVIEGGPAVAGYTYVWEPADDLDLTDPANPVGAFDEDGSLFVTITDPATGCVDTQTVVVDVAPEISFMTSPSDTVICAPGNITATGNTVNEAADITWYSDAELTMQIGTGSTIVIEATETGQTYTVYGEAVDPNTGCRQSTSTTVRVSDITASLPMDAVSTCAGDTPGIFGPEGPNGNLVYEYEPADVIDLSDPNNPVFVGNESTTVAVTVTDPATGCSTSLNVNFTVTDITGVSGTANPTEIFLGEDSELVVVGCEDCTYEWFPPNGTVTPNDGSRVIATPSEAGELEYVVVVTSPDGCTQEVVITLRVEDPLCDTDHIYVPNIFSPNGDSSNDRMQVRSNFLDQLTEFRWIIYNRWGQEVYSSDNPQDSWDGTIEGDDLEPDVYGYWLRVRCPAGQELIQQGNITIMR